LLATPARVIAALFALGVCVVTTLLWLPIAGEHGSVGFRTALFTATSAVCVTGQTLGDVATTWSTFGEIVIMVGVQLGGLGITVLASLLALLVSRRLGLSTTLLAQAETKTLDIGDVRRVLIGVGAVNVLVEGVLTVILWLRFWLSYDEPPGRAAYLGMFHAVAAFNHAGFSLFPDSLAQFSLDPIVLLPVAAAIILGSLGFPVLFELRHQWRHPFRWTVHAKIVVSGTVLLLIGGTAVLTVLEWSNPATLGGDSVQGTILNGFFASVTPRSAGFSTFDYADANSTTLLVTDILMFIGGGSAGVAGGIKITTFLLLFFAIMSESRGDPDVDAFGRRIPVAAMRQAVSVALLGVAVVASGVFAMLVVTNLTLDVALFEVTSSFSTSGLSTGVLPNLDPAAHYLLVVMMFVGRLGTVTLASALALRERQRLYRLPEERPIVG
jgi:Trk-type K+ transport system membrane component